MPIAPGVRLGQYEVQEFIGQGAMGLVYRAYHSQLERTGAVKVMQAIAPDPDAVVRFRHEAQAIAQMRHPNILNVYDFGEFQGTPYMIVEFVPGGSLADRLGGGPLDHPTTIKYLRGIAAGLDYAHSMGVVHRDVKPANVLLTLDDTPVLADFGLAKLLQGSSLKSMSGVTTGTPAYMAPEQVMGSQVGPAADRYALATIAYELSTGFIPFEGQALLELLYAQVHRYPDPPSARNRSLGPDVDAIIMRGLGKDPSTRWSSCALFVDALQGALAGRSLEPNARTVVMRPTPAPPPPAPRPSTGAAPALTAVMPAPQPSAPPISAPRVLAPAASPAAAAAAVYAGPPVSEPPPRSQERSNGRRSHRGLIVAVAGLAILVIAVVSLLAYAITHQQPVLSLSSTTVSPGENLIVNASKLPPNQSGEYELFSQVYVFPFKADGGGQVTTNITIPTDIQGGSHVLKICWNGVCHGQAALYVVALVPSPTPYTVPSPSPTAARTPSPVSPQLAFSSPPFRRGGALTIYGLHFQPGQTAKLTFIQGTFTRSLTAVTINGQGSFIDPIAVPAAATPGLATIRACVGTVCVSAEVTIAT